MSFMSWLCASFPRSKCFADGKKQFSVVKILNSSGEMKNRASWRHASFFFIIIIFIIYYYYYFFPSLTLIVKIFTHLPTL